MKSALVIGATRGIGKQIALKFAENGYKVCVAAKTTEHSDKLPGKCFKNGTYKCLVSATQTAW